LLNREADAAASASVEAESLKKIGVPFLNVVAVCLFSLHSIWSLHDCRAVRLSLDASHL
jgi:hypothetical protein